MAKGFSKATVPIAVQPGTRFVHLVFESDTHAWQVWINHDTSMQHGTYLRLEPNGAIERVTVRPDETFDTFRVREGGK
jgi:hypothetical protein